MQRLEHVHSENRFSASTRKVGSGLENFDSAAWCADMLDNDANHVDGGASATVAASDPATKSHQLQQPAVVVGAELDHSEALLEDTSDHSNVASEVVHEGIALDDAPAEPVSPPNASASGESIG